MTIVERVHHERELPSETRGYARDTITLGWEDRTHGHGRRRSDNGTEFGTQLPRGSVLRSGDCFVLETEQLVVSIVERPESVFLITPAQTSDWALFAYHIGNRHQPVMITDAALVCPDVPGVEALLLQHRMPYARGQLPFTPAATVVGHQH
ncbi:MAG TPA: hypothetical protein VGG73_09015 [Vicinamibacterales bacterium]